jgi:putative oxidoreductase
MKRLLSINYSAVAFNFSMLLLRLVFGIMVLVNHGYMKMTNFASLEPKFYNFLGMGTKATLLLSIFAEVFCALFIVLGLFTRFAAIPLVITMLVAVFGTGKPLIESELALLYLAAFTTVLFCGPGRISIDGMINK